MTSIVVGTAGHIDHGKSALVHALTGTDPDRLKEEKARGITIDLGFAHAVRDGVNLAFVDVPGHERFVKNMLAGAGGIDLVLLVVAADEGVKPQTREHFDICRLLQVRAGVVALTKVDLVDAGQLAAARLDVAGLVAGSFLERAPVLAVSSRTGHGLAELGAELAAAVQRTGPRALDGVVRLPIDRVFSKKGFGTVVTGTLASGRIRPNDGLRLEPGGRHVSVRGIQVHGARRDEAFAGERVAVNLSGIDVGDARRGQSLVTPDTLRTTAILDASIELVPDAGPLKHGTRVRVHQGTAEVLGRVGVIGPASPAGGPVVIGAGSRGFVRLRVESPLVVTRGDRYILRAYSPAVTIAGGEILDPQPPRGGVRSAAAMDRCDRLCATGADGDCNAAALIVEESGVSGLPIAALVWRLGLTPAGAQRVTAQIIESGLAVQVGDVLVQPAVPADLAATVVRSLETYHREHPLSAGLPREELRRRVFERGHPAVFDLALEGLVRAVRIEGTDRLRLAGHAVVLPPDEQRALEAIEEELLKTGLTPPDVVALAAGAHVTAAVAERLLKMLQRQGRVIKIDSLVFHREAIQRLKAGIAAMKAGAERGVILDVPRFKEQFGVTRKFAIPLLEYLDRERVTRRAGASRTIL